MAATASGKRHRPGTKGVPRGEREAMLIHSAAECFVNRGLNTSLDDIARTCGVSKAMIFTYFGSREGLLVRCLHDAGSRVVRAVLDAAGTGDTLAAQMLRTIVAILGATADTRTDWALINLSGLHDEPLRVATHYRDQFNRSGWRDLERLSLRQDGDQAAGLAMTLWSSILLGINRWWADHPEICPVEAQGTVAQLINSVSLPMSK